VPVCEPLLDDPYRSVWLELLLPDGDEALDELDGLDELDELDGLDELELDPADPD